MATLRIRVGRQISSGMSQALGIVNRPLIILSERLEGSSLRRLENNLEGFILKGGFFCFLLDLIS